MPQVAAAGAGGEIMHPAIARAKRWANRLPACRSRVEKNRVYRQMRTALFTALPRKADGTHPLDAEQMTLEVV